MKPQTVEELLNSMQVKYQTRDSNSIRNLENNSDTWTRIANKDSFDELDFKSSSEKDEFIKEWISENEYRNIN